MWPASKFSLCFGVLALVKLSALIITLLPYFILILFSVWSIVSSLISFSGLTNFNWRSLQQNNANTFLENIEISEQYKNGATIQELTEKYDIDAWFLKVILESIRHVEEMIENIIKNYKLGS